MHHAPDDEPTPAARSPEAAPSPLGPAANVPTPGGDATRDAPPGVVRRFAAQYRWTLDAVAAALRVDRVALEAYDRDGAPLWLRYALMGVAVQRGETAAALTWLVDGHASLPHETPLDGMRRGHDEETPP